MAFTAPGTGTPGAGWNPVRGGPLGVDGPVILSMPPCRVNPGVPQLSFVPASGVGAF